MNAHRSKIEGDRPNAEPPDPTPIDPPVSLNLASGSETEAGDPPETPAIDTPPPADAAPAPSTHAPPAAAPEETDAIKAQKTWEQLLRTKADFENYRKRAARERQDAVKFANESLLHKLFPVLDNLDKALNAATTTQDTSVEALQTGINMIFQQLKNVLTEAGLTEIDASAQPFDPKWHEAVSQRESAEVPEGHVLQQIRKGYKLHERLLRPAMVVVAKKPSS